MRLCIMEVEYERLRDMTTEILYKVASARAGGKSVIRFDIKNEDEQKGICVLNTLARILRGMKKRFAIQFFVTKEGFLRSSTEAQYILNVFPEVADALPADKNAKYIFVKI